MRGRLGNCMAWSCLARSLPIRREAFLLHHTRDALSSQCRRGIDAPSLTLSLAVFLSSSPAKFALLLSSSTPCAICKVSDQRCYWATLLVHYLLLGKDLQRVNACSQATSRIPNPEKNERVQNERFGPGTRCRVHILKRVDS